MKNLFSFRNQILLLICFCSFYYNYTYSQQAIIESIQEEYINEIDVEQMVNSHLKDFSLIRSRPKHFYGREYVYKSDFSDTIIFLTIGIYASNEIAEEFASSAIKEISIPMNNGPYNELFHGENIWWWKPSVDSENLTNILFVKMNVLITISSQNMDGLSYLANCFIQDINQLHSYISMKKSISPPVIKTVLQNTISDKQGDKLRLTLEVSDDNPEEKMEFQFSPGFSKLDSVSGNYYVFEADYSDYIIKNPNKELSIILINSQNQVSEIKRVKFTD